MGKRSVRRSLWPVEGSGVRGHTAFAATRSTGGERAGVSPGPATPSNLRENEIRKQNFKMTPGYLLPAVGV